MKKHLRSSAPSQRWLLFAQWCTLALTLALAPATQAWSQSTTVSGKVTSSDDGTSLPGVTIILKGSTQGTTTDAEGNYTLAVSDPNGTLVFSFIGFTTQEVALNGRTTVDIGLASDISELSEVVVIGYGEVKKSNVTGAIVSVKTEDLTRVPVGNVMESLQGSVPGMDVTRTSGAAGGNVSIRVRGQRSLTGSNDPLFIVDGVQYNNIQDLNPNDIERMEVLKDAASTAIYGSRGANGVILVTTKKGTSGKPKLSFNSYAGVSQLAGYPEMQDGAEYAALRREAKRAANQTNVFSVAEQEMIDKGQSTDWSDLLLRNGMQQDYQLGLTTGSDKTSFYVSLDYFKENGLFKNDELNRYSFRTNIDHTVSPKFKVGSQNQFTHYIQDIRRDPLNSANKLSPLEAAYDTLGNAIPIVNNGKTVNPLMDEQDGNYVNNTVVTRLFTSLYVEFKPFKDFSFRSVVGVTSTAQRDGLYASSLTVQRNTLKPITAVVNTNSLGINLENILSYHKKVGDHAFTLTGIQSLLRNKIEVHATSAVNQLIPDQSFYGIAGAPEEVTTGAPYTENGLLSYTGRLQYDFREKYIFMVVGRSDGASQLSEGNKWAFFPSVSGKWRISEEAFMANVQPVSDLGLRVSYGKAGNYTVKEYSSQNNLGRVPFAFDERFSLGYILDTKLGNDNLSWEVSTTLNAGIDYGLFGNKISGSIDLFSTHTKDLLLDRFLPASSGATKIIQNIGETETKGVELALAATAVQRDNLTWKIGASWFATREKIVSLPNGQDDVANGWFIGQPTKAFFDFEKVGIWQSNEDLALAYKQTAGQIKVKDQNEDLVIDNIHDRVIVGSERPNWMANFTSDLKFGNFDFSFQIFSRWGQTIKYDFANIYDPQANENSIKHNFWTPENPTNEYPRPNSTVSRSAMPYLSTLIYRDGSFVKLRSISLGYSLPKSVLDKTPFTRVRFYVNGRNLITWSKIDNYDPEGGGVETNPLTKLFVGGINVEF